jgi:thiol-disulfide isomerase/thioredoxin
MTDREKLEKFANWKESDTIAPCAGIVCSECPFLSNGDEGCSNNDSAKRRHEAKRLLAEMDNDWKPLEVDNLPPLKELLDDMWETQWLGNGKWYDLRIDMIPDMIKNLIGKHIKYRYRLRKHEPSVEELAEEYAGDVPLKGTMRLHEPPFETKIFEEIDIKHAYIAGYKKASL